MRCAGVSSIVQGTLVLAVVVLLLVAALARANNEFPSCTRLAELTHSMVRQPLNISLYWRCEKSRAAAELLASLLHYLYSCRRLRVVDGRHNTTAHSLSSDPSDDRLDIGVSIALKFDAAQDDEDSLLLNEPDSGASARPRRLHAWLSPAARSLHVCQNTTWKSYGNETMLALCGFINVSDLNHGYKVPSMEVFGVGDDCNSTMQRLQQCASHFGLPAYPRFLNHTELVYKMKTANESFLFLDYDVWKAESNVRAVLPPPRVHHHGNHKLDSAIDVNIADLKMVQEKAPHLFQFIQDFKPTRETLRQIVEQEANGVDIEEAVCNSTLTNRSFLIQYTIAIYLCNNDPDIIVYDNVARSMGKRINRESYRFKKYAINIKRFFTNCSDSYDMSTKLHKLMVYGDNVLGVVSQTVEGAEMASVVARENHVPLMLMDVVPENNVLLDDTTWHVAGRPQHLALAIQHLIYKVGLDHIAVLTQPTKLAGYYLFGLKVMTSYKVDDFEIPLSLTEREAKDALRNLRDTSTAKVIFVNADSETAAVILAAAVDLNVSDPDGFLWITRDWRQKDVTCRTKHFTASFWDRKNKGLLTSAPHATSLANALLTLSEGFKNVFQHYPNTQYDLHNAHVIRLFNYSLKKSPVFGINGFLHYKKHFIEETIVYIDEWCGDEFKKRLVTWRVNATSRFGAVSDLDGEMPSYKATNDMLRYQLDNTPVVFNPRSNDFSNDDEQ